MNSKAQENKTSSKSGEIPKTTPTPRANPLQRKHLLERIRTATYARHGKASVALEAAAPVNVKRARKELAKLEKLIDAWESSCHVQRGKDRERIEAEARACRERVLFSETEEALRAVQKFERDAA